MFECVVYGFEMVQVYIKYCKIVIIVLEVGNLGLQFDFKVFVIG